MKLLMHTCCAPCSVYCIDELRSRGIEPTLYWYNPNIHPYKEYEARRDCLKVYAEKINIEAIFEDEYGLDEFSMNSNSILKARKRISELEKYDCKELAEEILGLTSAEEVEKKLREFIGNLHIKE